MIGRLFPCARARSVFAIDYQKLYALGYRGIIFDIDNTLVHHGKDSTPEVDALFGHIHQVGFRTIMLSNNGVERIERFLRNIEAPYISNADKPKPDNYYRALELLELTAEQTVVIGDQIFTDILGANRSGIDSILVDFIRAPNETKIGIRRNLEKVVLWFYCLCPSRKKRLGDIWKESY